MAIWMFDINQELIAIDFQFLAKMFSKIQSILRINHSIQASN